MIYLDHSATTPIIPEALSAMLPWLENDYGNASSIYQIGRKARLAIEDARTTIAQLINAHPAEIIFTSGATESNNTIIRSALHESNLVSRFRYSSVEHHSVLDVGQWLHVRGEDSEAITVDENGAVEPTDVVANDQTLVSIMHVNNETGVVQPIEDLRSTFADSLFHTDAVQSFGKLPIDVQQLGVDFMSISAHKIGGPKGAGAMFIKKGIDFKAHQLGGGQERNRRAGTENVAAIVGLAAAARIVHENMEKNRIHVQQLRKQLIAELNNSVPHHRINEHPSLQSPYIVNVSFEDAEVIDGESLLQHMDINGVAVSNGSACVSGSLQPSHVLLAMGRSRKEAKSAVRFSLSASTSPEEITSAIAILAKVLRNMRVTTHK